MRAGCGFTLPAVIRGLLTDALGVLVSADETTLIVDGKRGLETIAVDTVIAAKPVPPPPAPRPGRF